MAIEKNIVRLWFLNFGQRFVEAGQAFGSLWYRNGRAFKGFSDGFTPAAEMFTQKTLCDSKKGKPVFGSVLWAANAESPSSRSSTHTIMKP